MMSGDELRNSFLQSFRVVLSSLKKRNEISLRTKRSDDTGMKASARLVCI